MQVDHIIRYNFALAKINIFAFAKIKFLFVNLDYKLFLKWLVLVTIQDFGKPSSPLLYHR